MNTTYSFLTDAQLKAEIQKCEYCAEKPCKTACPAHCSPADFIMAAHVGNEWDYRRAAAEILRYNPLGGVCGVVCPDYHCMKACVHEKFDEPVKIPAVQAAVIARAKAMNIQPNFVQTTNNHKKIAIIGAGPAGLSAAMMLAQKGYRVDIFEKENQAGGACYLIPEYRLSREVLNNDIHFLFSLKNMNLKLNTEIKSPLELLDDEYQAVLVAVGLWQPMKLGISNENYAIAGIDFLNKPASYALTGNVAVIGGGATACDCAITAKRNGANWVEMFALETIAEMPLPKREKEELTKSGIDINGRIRVVEIFNSGDKITGLKTIKVNLPPTVKFNLNDITDLPETTQIRRNIDHVIIAIGSKSDFNRVDHPAIFYAGDYENGPTSVVEAVASGKNAALEIDAYLSQTEKPIFEKKVKSTMMIPGYNMIPVSLETDFFGRHIHSPFLLSASPMTDGFDQMRSAYEAGWAGGIMKTAFDNITIHIPGEYMYMFAANTYGNFDNVSGHPLDHVCREIEQLVKLYPDRLTMGSTGGAVTGNDENDKKSWQSNTRKLENAGAMGIEYSLSCPQGGDGTEGDIVSQNARLTAKIIDWVMEIADPDIPKLFKLTGAVTSIAVIVNAVKEVFDRYPNKKAGITLANSFPTLCFRPGKKEIWEEGIVVGMSGEGILPISYLTLANAGKLNVAISGNGGPMDYKSAADFLALGAQTVQFCTIVMKYGYGIYDELTSGLSHLMEARGIKSVRELIGIALPHPVTDFMSLSPLKKISDCNRDFCLHCGNCTRCPYQAIQLDEEKCPITDAAKCIGCSICVQKCFSGALFMRERTSQEINLLKEG